MKRIKEKLALWSVKQYNCLDIMRQTNIRKRGPVRINQGNIIIGQLLSTEPYAQSQPDFPA